MPSPICRPNRLHVSLSLHRAEACPEGQYGRNCSRRCECEPNAVCDPMSGSCTCGPGWVGSFCERRCPDGFHGPECKLRCRCPNGRGCHHVTGQCGCTDASGADCPVASLQELFAETRPPTETKLEALIAVPIAAKPHCRCQHGATCSQVDGTCHCRPGFQGRHCESGTQCEVCHMVTVLKSNAKVAFVHAAAKGGRKALVRTPQLSRSRSTR
ncbi:hypothetical protein HPB49_017310 [Dermacentor silvarum]|uniref:Uncharacterized protein n=1 Tax=Dermacentor silvarum TaxID=543639 RepID=A0ACB8D6J8_DERSI|nr:hypothetical protein HPB49_017310 [Dermacentor silvarum]